MFLHRLSVQRISESGDATAVPLRQIDNFCMRNFTNDVAFDDTLPIADGLLEVGSLVPLEQLQVAMEDWFRRKGYLAAAERLRLQMLPRFPRDLSSQLEPALEEPWNYSS